MPPSRDHRLAISTLRADLDLLEEHAQGYQGTVKLSVAGPWTLAAMMERPRGDRVLADPGARRDLSQSLAEGTAQLVAELIRRLPDIEPLIQLDEPMLPAVLAGTIPTASGLSRHRAIEPNEVSGAVIYARDRLAPTPIAVHCCAADPPIELLRTWPASPACSLTLTSCPARIGTSWEQPWKRDRGSAWVRCPLTVRPLSINSALIK